MGGVVPATATPFDREERVDHRALERLLEFNIAQGADSFFIGGSSAECFLLSHDERIAVFETAAQYRDRAYMTAHVGAIATREAEDLARRAAALGYDAVAATPPFYYGFGSEAVYGYYADIAQASGLPVVIYNFPGNTNRPFDLADPVTRKLFKSDFIMGVKHTNQVVYQLERIKAVNPTLIVMNGFDETMVAGLALGADGNIGSTFNFMFPHYKKIYDLFRAGRLDEARALQVRANDIMNALCDVGLIPAIKYVLGKMGVDVGVPRRPFRPLGPEQCAMLDRVLAENLRND
ncbi:MAG: dihydrodipicolinate synthase family protein [Clostridiales bacterium]|nr:dihydrodipicolinate synthase family protein [Clostridiales bacterium]